MKPTLLVLAAGMGSRFGGLKQMEPIGPNGEWILDYSVQDARKAGFGKVVFVIRKEMESEFRNLTETKYSDGIEVRYAFQDLRDIPVAVSNIESREKPWGTGHAVYAARDHLDSPFAVINADDFYGAEAFQTLSEFLSDSHQQESGETYSLIGYRLVNTLSEHGSVSRGVCQSSEDGTLETIEEHSEIAFTEDGLLKGKNATGAIIDLPPETIVSLNCWGFPKNWAARLEPLFAEFLQQRGHEAKSEFYLPAAVDSLVKSDLAKALVLPCNAKWLGVTYREDLPKVREAIAKLHSEGVY